MIVLDGSEITLFFMKKNSDAYSDFDMQIIPLFKCSCMTLYNFLSLYFIRGYSLHPFSFQPSFISMW